MLPPTARATVTLARALRETVRPLSVALDAQRTRLLDLRAALALSVLHTDMALLVAADLIAGTAIGDPARSIGDLASAVAVSIEEGRRPAVPPPRACWPRRTRSTTRTSGCSSSSDCSRTGAPWWCAAEWASGCRQASPPSMHGWERE
ncbi:hypothetical protein GCM10025873_06950 [Demequina sediminis]|uniref:hypothetical protein n=1 Tax=Demequina sediminis TaxID=1930058 RepID=UPI00257363BD|nr:hypothetical protein [Demequina sediminis]BDZ60904.1 hypothetical protein GCM10025873_06950 [Demequina sediminis]